VDNWHSTQIESFLNGDSEETLLARMAEQAAALGFEFFAFGMRSPVPVSRPRIILRSSYPLHWQRQYDAQKYLSNDPSVPKALKSSMPIVWSDALFAENPQLWDEARAIGLRVGCAQAHIDGRGVQSMLTLARTGEPITPVEMLDKAHRLQWLTHLLHQSYVNTMGTTLVPEAGIKLVEREVEVLRWTAEGKTSADIAEILRISERTVNFHLNNASAKLGTCNKTAASVKAALLGLIW
jgi:LuxR family transcriptional regulator, quorum-sensing system regulator SolR